MYLYITKMEPEFNKLREWLDISQQQFDVFKVIYQLETREIKATIPTIEDEYLKEFSIRLQRPNLHGILRILIQKGMIVRSSRGEYGVNYSGITLLLNKSENSIKKRWEEIRQFKSEYVENMKKMTDSSQIIANVLKYSTFYDTMGKILKTADKYYCINRFPGICYSHTISHAIGRGYYGGVLTERCLGKKELQVTYLSYLDVHRPFSHAMKVFKNADKAYKECLLMIEQLENQIQNTDVLDVRYLAQPSEWDIQVVVTNQVPEDVFIILRTLKGDAKSILHVKSEDVGKHACSIFEDKMKNSDRVTPENVGHYTDKMKKDLKKVVTDYREKR